MVQRIRTKVKAHVGGEEAREVARLALQQHGSYAAHFSSVCQVIIDELKRIEQFVENLVGESVDS